MKETALQVHQRKIRNGLRKQAEARQREKEKVWDRLKEVKKPGLADIQINTRQVQMQGRALRTGWKVEEATDLGPMFGLDMQQELIDSLSRELVKEQDELFKASAIDEFQQCTRRVRSPGLKDDE